MNRKKHIYILCPSLNSGGAERVVVYLLKHLDRKKYTLHLLLLKREGAYLGEIPDDVEIINLNKKHKLDFLKIIFMLAFSVYWIKKPDLILSFLDYTNLLALLALLLSPCKPKIMVSVRIHISEERHYKRWGFLRAAGIKLLYPRAKKIIAVSRGVGTDLINRYHLPPQLLQVIYNGINPAEIRQKAAEPLATAELFKDPAGLILVASGRLVRQKNFALLINALAIIKDKIKAKLLIIGEGGERQGLEELIVKQGLDGNIRLLGFQANPFKFFEQADIFLFSSNCEGFPNTLLEAMACGKAIVATDCYAGPDEIIRQGIDGLLIPVNNVEQMADSITKLAQDPTLREALARGASERIKDFSINKMIGEYEKLIETFVK
jgi:glycosyltransferase involved in cell wall biosynthesis